MKRSFRNEGEVSFQMRAKRVFKWKGKNRNATISFEPHSSSQVVLSTHPFHLLHDDVPKSARCAATNHWQSMASANCPFPVVHAPKSEWGAHIDPQKGGVPNPHYDLNNNAEHRMQPILPLSVASQRMPGAGTLITNGNATRTRSRRRPPRPNRRKK